MKREGRESEKNLGEKSYDQNLWNSQKISKNIF